MLLMMKMVVFVMMMFVAFEEFLLGRFDTSVCFANLQRSFCRYKNVTNTSSTSFSLQKTTSSLSSANDRCLQHHNFPHCPTKSAVSIITITIIMFTSSSSYNESRAPDIKEPFWAYLDPVRPLSKISSPLSSSSVGHHHQHVSALKPSSFFKL